MSQPRALFAGSFDPITLGHVDLIERAARLFWGLVVAVGTNVRKAPTFDLATRVAMAREATAHVRGLEVVPFDGLLVDFARAKSCAVLVRGIRGVDDYAFETTSAHANRALAPELETVWLVASQTTGFISSTMVREVAANGGDASSFVPPGVAIRLTEKFPRASA